MDITHMIFLCLLLMINYLFGIQYLVGCIRCCRYYILYVFMFIIQHFSIQYPASI